MPNRLLQRWPLLALLTVLAALPFGLARSAPDPTSTAKPGKPRAVVLLIGDGLGFSQVAFSRNVMLPKGERFAFEKMPVTGLVSTWSASNWVTDSGASATAFSAGVKTLNRFVGWDTDAKDVRSITERAKAEGWRVGYVTTTSITHATPAAFYAGGDRYDDVDKIAAQLLAHRADVALGGGELDFLPKWQGGKQQGNLDLLKQARESGFTVWTKRAEVTAEPKLPLLGVFGYNHLPYELDRDDLPEAERPPTLEEMTRTALAALERTGEPFFLMIEGGRIDHAAHGFDAAGVAAETAAFDRAVQAVEELTKRHPDTLVLLTADHATGGLAINDYADWSSFPRQLASLETVAKGIRRATDPFGPEEVGRLTGWGNVTEADLARVRNAPDPYASVRELGTLLGERNGITWIPRINEDDTKGHTGEDVPLYARGLGAERFTGSYDNADIPKRLAEILGWGKLN